MNTAIWMQNVINLLSAQSATHADLADFQRAAVGRIVEMCLQFGGALLADSVGLGKTRVSLHAAIQVRRRLRNAQPILVCAPARLVTMWQAACEQAGLRPDEYAIISHTALSRSQGPTVPSVVIVDEAHHFRNPKTQRGKNLELLTLERPTILVTATPIVNSAWDLYHLLRYFLADHDLRAWTGHDLNATFRDSSDSSGSITELLQLVCVRRTADQISLPKPKVQMRQLKYEPSFAERWVWKNLEPELRALNFDLFEGDWPRGLFVDHLLRVWEGGAHALSLSLGQLVSFHERWLELAGQGRRLQRADFSNFFGQAGEQAVLSFMFDQGGTNIQTDRVAEDLARLHHVLDWVHRSIDESSGLLDALIDLMVTGEKWVIFATYQRTAEGLFDALCRRLGPKVPIGMITGDGGRATGLGRTQVDDILKRFAPQANGMPLDVHQQLQLLVCTDCISEGVNLQDCSNMVFIDLPWTPHAVEQRVGRLVRPGSRAETVNVYLPRPHNWNDTLGLRHRIATKASTASDAALGYTLIGKQQATNPLATLTKIDQLRSGTSTDKPGHFIAISNQEVSWQLFEIRTNGFSRFRLCREGLSTEFRLEELLPEMIGLIDHPIPASRCAPVEAEVADKLWNTLQAAALAPVQLEDVQLRAWNQLRSEPFDDTRWEELRSRLLGPLTRGQKARLQQIHDQPETLVREVMTWRPFRCEVEVELIASLQLTREAIPSVDLLKYACADETQTVRLPRRY